MHDRYHPGGVGPPAEAQSMTGDRREPQPMAIFGPAVSYNPLRDRALLAWSAWWSFIALGVFGVLNAIIPNPVFARGIAVEGFAVVVWLVSAPLIGVVMATYFAPIPPSMPIALGPGTARSGSTLGTLGGFAAFVAIGCPTCNKIALIFSERAGPRASSGPSSRSLERHPSSSWVRRSYGVFDCEPEAVAVHSARRLPPRGDKSVRGLWWRVALA